MFYRQRRLVIDGKYSSDDGLSTSNDDQRCSDNRGRATTVFSFLNSRWPSDLNKSMLKSKGCEAFLIVGSHPKFPTERGSSDLNIDKKSALKRRIDLRR
jgi:hypothetical protein